MDIAICVHRLRPNAKWGSAATYADLQRTWQDEIKPIPSLQEIEMEWLVIQNEEQLNAVKKAEGEIQKANLINVYNAIFNGTGTTGERATRLEKSLCWIVRHNLNLVD